MKQNHTRNIFRAAAVLTLAGLLFTDFGLSVPTAQETSGPTLAKQAQAQSPSQIYVWAETQGYGYGGVIALASTDTPAVRTSSYNISGSAEVSLYEADLDSLLAFLVHDKDWKQKTKDTDISGFLPVATLRHDINTEYQGSLLTLPLAESGIWFLRIKLAGVTRDSFIIRSRTGAVVKEGDNEFIFWAQDFKTGRSVTAGSVRTLNLLEGRRQIGSASFNAQGIARMPISPDSEIALVEVGGDTALVPVNLHYLNTGFNYQQFSPKSRQIKYFIFTDRPLYRPGDKVYFKSILRDDDDARYTIPTGNARVVVTRNWDEQDVAYERTIPIGAQGTISGEFDLPAGSETGEYQLKVLVSEPGSQSIWSEYYTSAYFQVEHFRKPEYSIEISTAAAEVIAGDPLSFEISGNYFFGQPLRNQKIKYIIYSADYHEYEYLQSQSYIPGDSYRYGWWASSKFSEGEVTLDEEGLAKVSLDAKIPSDKTASQIFSIEAELDDGTGNPSFARKNALIYAGEYGIYRGENSVYSTLVGERYVLPVKLAPYQSASVSGIELRATVQREDWVAHQEPDKKYPTYQKQVETLPELAARTDGAGNAEFSFVPAKKGSYKFTIQGRDTRGNTVVREFWAWVTEKGESFYFGQGDSELQVQAEKNQYAPGETARLAITSSLPDRDVLLSFERGRVNRFQVVRLSGKVARVDIPLVGTDMPNIFAKVGSFSQSAYDQSAVNIPVSTASRALKVSLTPDRESYGPGDTVTVNVQSTDSAGTPLSAEIAVWAVDKAIFELVDERPLNIFDAFWAERYNDTQESHSLRGITETGAEGGGCFAAGTEVAMADGSMKAIEKVAVGDTVRTRRGESDDRLVAGKVIGTHQATVNGYIIINGNLKVTANHRLWVNGAWQEAGALQIGDVLTDLGGDTVKVESVEWLTGKFEVYNLEIEEYRTYFAGGIWAHNQKGDGGRTVFKDTAYWNPTVRTNAAGQAQVRFTLPDNLTTWVIAAVGSTIDTKVGNDTAEVTVTKDLVVRPVLPNILRVGDEVVVSAIVQNFTELEQSLDIELTFDSGRVEGARAEAVLAAKDLKQIYWKVAPEKDNEKAKFIFSAKARDNERLADAVTLEIPVWSFGFWENRAETGDGAKTFPISLAEDSDEAKSKIVLSVAPTLAGTLPTAMEYLVGYPYGCVEQTTSRFVPAVIAKLNPDLFASAIADRPINEIILTGVNRLMSLQHRDGGWSWWGAGDSNAFITAYVVEYLVRARQAGIAVDDGVLSNAQRFLEGVQGGKEETAAKIYGLTFLNSPLGKTIIADLDGLTPDFLALAVMANYKNGERNPDRGGLNRLIALAKPQGDGLYWPAGKAQYFGSDDASTAFAIRAIVAAGGDREVAAKGARYLIRNRQSEYWSNTFATAQIVQAIVDLSRTGRELVPDYSYFVNLDGKRIASGSVRSASQVIQDIEIDLSQVRSGGSTLEIAKERGEGQMYSTLVIREFRTDKNLPAQSHGISVKREYVNEKGSDFPLGVGDIVLVNLTVSGLGTDEYYGIIDDELPAGLIPVNVSLANEHFLQSPQEYYNFYYFSDQEVTQNGMETSLYRIGREAQIYTYKARAVTSGVFAAPPVSVALMYAPEVYGRSESQTVTIVSESGAVFERGPLALADRVLGKNKAVAVAIILLVAVMVIAVILHSRGQLIPFIRRMLGRSKDEDDASSGPGAQPPAPPSE